LTARSEKKEPLIAPIFQSSSLLSFTSLAQSSPESDSLKEPFFQLQDFTSHTIPKGKETGIFIHSIFERLFSFPKPIWRDFASIEKFVIQAIEETSFLPWKNAIVDMVWKTISQPLPPGFSLLEIEPQNIQTEMEFLFSSSPNFVKGFIDLVFYFEDKYYIVDWKTNWLGPDQLAYSSMEEAMTSHDYSLQAALYTEALARHVKQFDIRPFQDIFGGAIYLFVRGPGVCHFIPDLTLIEKAMYGY
jgi:exodeoxyribonuclease V beta subunit